MRRGARRALAAASAALAPAAADPVLLRRWAMPVVGLFVFALAADVVFATGPWEIAVGKLCMSFDGPLGRGLALVAVIGGTVGPFALLAGLSVAPLATALTA